MSMYSITGQLVMVYEDSASDGEGGSKRVTRAQLLGEVPKRDGAGTRYGFEDVNIPRDLSADFRALEGCNVTIPIGMFAPAKGRVIMFVPEGSRPQESN